MSASLFSGTNTIEIDLPTQLYRLLQIFDDTYRFPSHGEIWLFNNDLRFFLDAHPFQELYLSRIAERHDAQIDAVKVVLGDGVGESLLNGKPDDKLAQNLALLARTSGVERLSTFYFATMKEIPESLKTTTWAGYTCIFYTHGGTLEDGDGCVMLRPNNPDDGEEPTTLVAYGLKHHPFMLHHSKQFQDLFGKHKDFRWLRAEESSSGYKFSLEPGESPETK